MITKRDLCEAGKSLGNFALVKIFEGTLVAVNGGEIGENNHQFWACLQKNLACVHSSSRASVPTGSGYNVPLVPPSRMPWPRPII